MNRRGPRHTAPGQRHGSARAASSAPHLGHVSGGLGEARVGGHHGSDQCVAARDVLERPDAVFDALGHDLCAVRDSLGLPGRIGAGDRLIHHAGRLDLDYTSEPVGLLSFTLEARPTCIANLLKSRPFAS